MKRAGATIINGIKAVEGIAVMIFFVAGAFLQGFYFFKQYIFANLIIILYAGLLACHERRKLPYEGATVSLFVFVALYFLSALYGVNREGAIYEALRVAGFIPAYMVGFMWDSSRIKWMEKGIVLSSVMVSLLGLAVLSGLIFLEGALYEGRIQSTLHYANVAAVYMLMGIVLTVKRMAEAKKRTLYNVYIFLLMCGLILTYSRGVWILLFILSMGLVFYRVSNCHDPRNLKIRYVYIALVSCITAVALSSCNSAAWFAGILLTGIFLCILPDFLKQGVYVWAIEAAMIVSLPMLHLFSSPVYNRIKDIRLDATEWAARMAYYKGAIRIINDYPLLGSGGMGWAVLCESYAADYVKYVHNYYLQVLTDVGLIGFTAFLIFTVNVLYTSLKKHRDDIFNLALLAIILLHSFIDIGMHFQLIAIIFFIYCGKIKGNQDELSP
ncbi:MAG: O-antigen ligase family protein [Clostridiaceae bacterium]|nr:O-antigen ligase family protein [Clostridiaceae bacterium]